MDEIIGGVDTFTRCAQALLVKNVAFDDLGARKSAIEALGIASHAAHVVSSFEETRNQAPPDVAGRAGHQNQLRRGWLLGQK
jgi:hypothetical protein